MPAATREPEGVIITGASSGIGAGLAVALAATGRYKLGLTGRRLKNLEELRDRLAISHPAVHVEIRQLDVTDVEDVYRAFGELLTRLGSVEIVVANAGTFATGRVGDGLSRFKGQVQCVETNLIGAMATIDCAVQHFKKVGKGHVVSVSSVSSFHPVPNMATYAATKSALNFYVEGLRLEVAGKNIQVTNFLPGFVESEMTEKATFKPFMVPLQVCVDKMIRGIERKSQSVVIPWFPWIIFKYVPGHLFLKGPKQLMLTFGSVLLPASLGLLFFSFFRVQGNAITFRRW